MVRSEFLVIMSLVLGLDITFIIMLYRSWIKKNSIALYELKSWKGTRKPYIWFLVWSIIIVFNVPLSFVVYLLMYLTKLTWLVYILFSIILIYPLIIGVAYICIKSYLKEKEK